MTNRNHIPTDTASRHLSDALARARELTESPVQRPISVEWMQAAEHAGDLSVLALALLH